MRNLPKMREIASEAPLPSFEPYAVLAPGLEGSSPMLNELIPSTPSAEWNCAPGPRSSRAFSPLRLMQRAEAESEQRPDPVEASPGFLAIPCAGGKSKLAENSAKESAVSNSGHTLFQEWFFFCRVKRIGDAPGTESIYVETVVDRDSGVAFAKVYPAKNVMNAVDILSSRVVPFFERLGIAIKEIHTRKTSEYCGLPPAHPFETFLAASHIEHLETDRSSQLYTHPCEEFYRFLLKEFFPLALRRHFQLSLTEMQKELDTFVEAYNAMQMKRGGDT